MDPPPPKRQRAAAARLSSPLSPGVLSPAAQDAVRASYGAALPYQHAVIEPLCDAARMALVKDEITRNLRADFKETDLFKLYQTIDLANLDLAHSEPAVRELSAKMPQLLALRDALYTPEFRGYMQHVTGCPELTDRVDMAASIFVQGCHLLCHDDVIGTRAVSFIVYLSGEDWKESDGGALELYPLEQQPQQPQQQQQAAAAAAGGGGVPAAHPTAGVLPKNNTMAIFGVKAGRSYHSVQEVYADRTPRLSIQGWYHAAVPPTDIEKASLSQLKASKSSDPDRFTRIEGAVRYPGGDIGGGGDAAAAGGGADSEATKDAERAELSALKLGELSKRARLKGTSDELVDHALDADNPKASLIELLLSQQPTAAAAAAAAGGRAAVAPEALAAYEAAWVLTEADSQFLADWIHPTYLKADSFEALRKEFALEGSVQLQKFLTPERASKLSETATARDNAEFSSSSWPAARPKPEYTAGLTTNDGWTVVGPAHMQRYLRFAAPAAGAPVDGACKAGQEFAAVKDVLFGSVAFARLMYAMTGLRPVGVTAEARRFRPGLDYTVAHHGLLEQDARLDATLSFIGSGGGEEASEAWESGGVGAYECYIAADDEELTAAEVYGGDEDEGNQLLSVASAANTLNLVMRDEGTMKFVKYVSHAAPSSRWDVAAVYEVDQDDTDSDDEDDDDYEGDASIGAGASGTDS